MCVCVCLRLTEANSRSLCFSHVTAVISTLIGSEKIVGKILYKYKFFPRVEPRLILVVGFLLYASSRNNESYFRFSL